MIVKLQNEHHLEFLNLKGGCRGSSESTHVKMPHCWKSNALAQILCIQQEIDKDVHKMRFKQQLCILGQGFSYIDCR